MTGYKAEYKKCYIPSKAYVDALPPDDQEAYQYVYDEETPYESDDQFTGNLKTMTAAELDQELCVLLTPSIFGSCLRSLYPDTTPPGSRRLTSEDTAEIDATSADTEL